MRESLHQSANRVTDKVAAQLKKDLPENLAYTTAEEANQMAYKSMSNGIYYPVVIVLYSVEVFLSIAITDIGPVFAWISLIAGTALSYYLPSMFVITGYNLFATHEYKDENRFWINVAKCNFVVGILSFLLSLSAVILGLPGVIPK